MALLSKSKYLMGLQCPKYLWTALHEPDKIPEHDEATKHRFEQGHLIGELAKKWFQEGIDIPTKYFKENLIQTNKLLNLKQTEKPRPLFEPGIKAEFSKGNEIYSRADILDPFISNQRDIIEVKSGTRVKPVNISDVSFQKYVYEKAGLRIRKCFLMIVNNEYVKKGDINPKQLLKIIDITREVEKEIKDIDKRIENIFNIINSKTCPKVSIGQHCKDPYQCPITKCWDFLPSESIFELYYGGKRCFELFEQDIQTIKDIPEDFKLTRQQQKIQIRCAKTNKPHINKEKIKQFLNKLQYPLYYLDFETINPAIPIFDNSHPYQQIPFQFSLHTIQKPESKPQHFSFLAKGDKDPRPGFIKALKENLGNTGKKGKNEKNENQGSIIVYNESFEKNVLEKLAQFFPKEKDWVKNTKARIIDLLKPFRNFDYYNKKQKGSASIKAVLPALTTHLPKGIKAYNKMNISKGDEASLAFLKIALGEHKDFPNIKISKEEQAKTRRALEEYCELDTLAEVLIVGALRELVN